MRGAPGIDCLANVQAGGVSKNGTAGFRRTPSELPAAMVFGGKAFIIACEAALSHKPQSTALTRGHSDPYTYGCAGNLPRGYTADWSVRIYNKSDMASRDCLLKATPGARWGRKAKKSEAG